MNSVLYAITIMLGSALGSSIAMLIVFRDWIWTDPKLLSGACYPGGWWFRILGRGIHYHDHRVVEPLFSERMGFKKRLRLGPHCFGLLWGRSWQYPYTVKNT